MICTEYTAVLEFQLSAHVEEYVCFALRHRLFGTHGNCAVIEMIPDIVMYSIGCVVSRPSSTINVT